MSRRALSLALALAGVTVTSAALAQPEPPAAAAKSPAPATSPVDPAKSPDSPVSPERRGSLATTAPLGARRIGMSLGGGVAVLLPFYAIEAGVGLGRVDLVGRFESEIGVLHYPRLGVRWAALDIGAWTLGLGLGVNYSFFGIETDQLNLTSTFYIDGEVGISGPITPHTDLFFFVDSEFDLFEHDVVDDESVTRGTYRYDATLFKLGIRTELTHDLDGYLRARVRIPVETFTYEAMNFYVIPSLEIGGTWTF